MLLFWFVYFMGEGKSNPYYSKFIRSQSSKTIFLIMHKPWFLTIPRGTNLKIVKTKNCWVSSKRLGNSDIGSKALAQKDFHNIISQDRLDLYCSNHPQISISNSNKNFSLILKVHCKLDRWFFCSLVTQMTKQPPSQTVPVNKSEER